MKDALGKIIEVDKVYGHSTRTSGFVTVVIGRVMELNDKGVVLNIIHRGQSSFDNDMMRAVNHLIQSTWRDRPHAPLPGPPQP